MSVGFPSPNHGDRRGQRPELVVLHYTGMADTAEARARLLKSAEGYRRNAVRFRQGLAAPVRP